MSSSQELPLDEIQWRSLPIAQSMGGIQTNTGNLSSRRPINLMGCWLSLTFAVLPYFSHSPFFDVTSNNAFITNQATFNPNIFYLIQTREAFEGHLRTMQGLEYMVTQDPSANGTKIDHNGVWIIQKRQRRKRLGMEDELIGLSFYFVIGENIYMAPSVGNVLGTRTVSFEHIAAVNIVMLKDF